MDDLVTMPRAAAQALFDLYDVVWNKIAFLDGDDPKYSAIERTDQNLLDEASESVEPHESAIRSALAGP